MGQREIKNNVRKKWDGKMDGMDGWMDGWTVEIDRIDGRERSTGWID